MHLFSKMKTRFIQSLFREKLQQSMMYEVKEKKMEDFADGRSRPILFGETHSCSPFLIYALKLSFSP